MAITRPIDELTPEAQAHLEGGGALRDGQIPETITSGDLVQTEPINFQTVTDTPASINGVDTGVTTDGGLGDVGTQAQTLTEQLMQSTQSLLGESALTTQQEQEQDVAGLTQIQQDAATQVQNLFIESQRLANEFAGVPDVMQQQAAGRGITAGGLKPLTAGEQRKIAIQQRSVASQALTAYAAFNSAKGNLQTALDAVDRAVAIKYDPIRERIKVDTANLKLLLESPALTVEEEKRAQDRLNAQNAKERFIDKQEADEKAKKEFLASAINLGITIDDMDDYESYQDAFNAIAPEIARLANEGKLDEQKLRDLEIRNFEQQMDLRLKEFNLKRDQILQAELDEIEEIRKTQDAATEKALSVFTKAEELLTHPGLGAATGPIGAWIPTWKTFTGATIDFDASFDAFKASLTLDNLKLMSGVLSDTDIKILQDAGTKLRKNMNAKDFKKEVQRIKDLMDRTVTNNGITEDQASFYFGFTQENLDEVNQLYGGGGSQSTPTFNPSSYY